MDAVKSSDEVFSGLVADGLLSHDQLQIGVIESKRTGELLDKTLLKLGFITETLLNNAILTADSSTLNAAGAQSISLDAVVPDPDALAYIPAEMARRYTVIPVSLKDQLLVVATTDIYNLPVQDRLRSQFGTDCLLYTSPSPRDQRGSRMPSSA